LNTIFNYRILKSIAVLIIAAVLFSCKNDLQDVQDLSERENQPESITKDIEIIYSDSGEVKVLVKSPLLYTYTEKDDYMEMPKGIKVFFYDTAQQVSSFLTAKYAVSYERTKKMEAKHDVVVFNKEGEELNTEHLIWDQQTRKIYSNEFVKIITKDEIIHGEGMEADETFNNWKIKKPKATILVNQEAQDSITE
jgi:LPS export ABC transporter protein LptC